MLARDRARSACGGRRLSPTARLQRKSTVCGLNGFLPSAKADGPLHLNPRPLRALAPPPLCAVLKRQLRFRERREEQGQMAQPKR
jgi:hypothetical protein